MFLNISKPFIDLTSQVELLKVLEGLLPGIRGCLTRANKKFLHKMQGKTNAKESQRKVPKTCQKILHQDSILTEKFCRALNRFLPFRSLRKHHKVLEITCHGLLWLPGWLFFIWITYSPKLYQMQFNFFIGLILDIIFIAVIKAYVRRRRPSGNSPDMFATYGPDKYSFPSGHASRVTYIVCFFTLLYPLPWFCFPPMFAWLVSLCISRILMKRHYVLDVVCGIVVGIVESIIISNLWFSQELSTDMLSFLTEGY